MPLRDARIYDVASGDGANNITIILARNTRRQMPQLPPLPSPPPITMHRGRRRFDASTAAKGLRQRATHFRDAIVSAGCVVRIILFIIMTSVGKYLDQNYLSFTLSR